MQKNVLIVSHQDDAHADNVGRQLLALGACPIRLNTEYFGSGANLSLLWESDKSLAVCQIQLPDGQIVDTDSVFSVWYRRPKSPELEQYDMTEEDHEFACNQWNMTFAGLLTLLSGALWVSSPNSIALGSRKPLQLNIARHLGFKTPTTLITADPNIARNFYEHLDGNVVIKPSGRGWTDDGIIYTNRLEPQHLEFLNELAVAPVVLQELIPKSYEIRATVVGQRLLAVKIESQASERSALDWRRYDVEHTPYSSYTLPGEIEERCIRLVKDLNLQYGAIDLIRTPEGGYVFLEINCSGQFLWAEVLSRVGISAAIARLLTGIDPPL